MILITLHNISGLTCQEDDGHVLCTEQECSKLHEGLDRARNTTTTRGTVSQCFGSTL